MSNDYESLKIGSDSVNLNSINAVDDSLNEGDGGVIVRGNSVKYEDSISDRVADSVNKLTDNVKCIDKSDDSVNKVADGVNKDEDSVSCGDRFKDGAHKAVDSVNKDEESVKSVILLVLRTRSFYVIFLQILFTVWAFAFINGLYKVRTQRGVASTSLPIKLKDYSNPQKLCNMIKKSVFNVEINLILNDICKQ